MLETVLCTSHEKVRWHCSREQIFHVIFIFGMPIWLSIIRQHAFSLTLTLTRDQLNSRFHGRDTFREIVLLPWKRRLSWNPWFFVNFSTFSLIYDNSRVLSAAFVRMLLFATCRTSALSSWHWLSWVLAYSVVNIRCSEISSFALAQHLEITSVWSVSFRNFFREIWHILKILPWNHAFFSVNSVGP